MGIYTVKLTVATGSCAVFQTMTVNINDGVGIQAATPNSYNLVVQPNPFAGNTEIDVQVTKDCNLSIALYDQLGQLVQNVTQESLSAGQYKYTVAGMSSGVYYLTVDDGSKSRTMKLISLK
jgi:hypothetical protein